MKRLALSIISIVVLLFIQVLTLPTTSVWAATYYLRADGTAPSKAAATSGASASTAMSVTTHNSETFEAGDHIRLCDTGGTFKASIIAPSSGEDGHPIVYEAAPGQRPVIDLSMLDNKTGWSSIGGGKYIKGSYGFYGRVVWEDGVVLHPASSGANVGVDGSWYYTGGVCTYKPSSGTPADHNLVGLWFDGNPDDWGPYGIDIRNRSNIEISGITFNRCGCAVGHAQNLSNPVSLIKNISIHDNIISQNMWAIWGQVKNNGIEQDVEIYNNSISYCNSGISTWTASDQNTAHTQHPLRHNIHHNKITHHFSIDDTYDWIYALKDPDYWFDHEGISFQDPMDCTVADNLISVSDSITRQFGSGNNQYWTRAIVLYMNPMNTKTSGNKVLRNRIQGRYYPAIYICGNPDPTNGGFENNIIACNVLECANNTLIYMAFWFYTGALDNTATGMNYWCNNTINYAGGAGGEGNQALFMRYEDSGYWTFKNNIIVAPAAVNTFSNAIGKSYFDHNNYYNTKTSPFTYYTTNKTFAEWKALSVDFDNIGSYAANPELRPSDSALTTNSPAYCQNGGTPIEGVTVIDGVGQLGIDGRACDPTHPAMGAYAQPSDPAGASTPPGKVGARPGRNMHYQAALRLLL